MKKLIIVIDAQNDFTHPKGSLNVDPDGKVVSNICKFLEKHNDADLMFTMDAHPENHISFCEHWISFETPVEPFTKINSNNLKRFDNVSKEDRKFIEKVKEFTVYPKHCVDGDWGYCINSKIAEVSKKFENVFIEEKGKEVCNDSYSVLSNVTKDFFNDELLKKIEEYDEIYVCGFCLDICVSQFLRDLCRHSPETLLKTSVIINCTAPADKDFEYYNDMHYQYMCLKGLATIEAEL